VVTAPSPPMTGHERVALKSKASLAVNARRQVVHKRGRHPEADWVSDQRFARQCAVNTVAEQSWGAAWMDDVAVTAKRREHRTSFANETVAEIVRLT
jgi:hypothetical protein